MIIDTNMIRVTVYVCMMLLYVYELMLQYYYYYLIFSIDFVSDATERRERERE